jgi:hypothetical protein
VLKFAWPRSIAAAFEFEFTSGQAPLLVRSTSAIVVVAST